MFYFLGLFLFVFLQGFSIDFTQFSSVDDLIKFESKRIENFTTTASKAEGYLDRIESYFLLDEYEHALSDVHEVHALISQIPEDKVKFIEFRLLFDELLIRSCLQLPADHLFDRLMEIIDTVQCSGCSEQIVSCRIFHPMGTCAEILGPDYNPPGYCEEIVTGTANAMKVVVSKNPKRSVQWVLLELVEALEKKALDCCRSGAFWKTCVGPIVDKWKQWNDKWTIFSIPPDPAWD